MPQRRSHDEKPSIETPPVELDIVISAARRLCLSGAKSDRKFSSALSGHPVMVWAGMRSIHVRLAGEFIRTRQSRPHGRGFSGAAFAERSWGPEPSGSAAQRGAVPTGTAVKIDRIVARDGDVTTPDND